MVIKGHWAQPCPECGAIDGCCATSKARRDVSESLSRLVARQSATITNLTREVAEAYQVIADIRRDHKEAA